MPWSSVRLRGELLVILPHPIPLSQPHLLPQGKEGLGERVEGWGEGLPPGDHRCGSGVCTNVRVGPGGQKIIVCIVSLS